MSNRASNPGSPLGRLIRERQSVWLDYIRRTMLKNGEMKALIEARGVRGVTSNPTIFEQAIGKSDPWFTGLLAVCALAAIQAMVAFYASTAGTILARDVYRRYLNPEAGDRELKTKLSSGLAGPSHGDAFRRALCGETAGRFDLLGIA